MKVDAVNEIIDATTTVFRKGAEVEQQGNVTHVWGYPHVDDTPADLVKVDLHFVVVGVNPTKAEEQADELRSLLSQYPHPDRLAQGPSYIEVGGELGSQEYALRLFALGKVLAMWDVVTPERLGIEGSEADEMAGMGLVMMSGWKP